MEVTEQTELELKLQEEERFNTWNKMINEKAKEIVEFFNEDVELTVYDVNSIITLLTQMLNAKVNSVKLNELINKE